MLHHGTPSRPNHAPNGVRFTGRSTRPMWEIASASARRPAALPLSRAPRGPARPGALERRAGLRAAGAVDVEPVVGLERAHGGGGRHAVGAVDRAGRVAQRRQRLLEGEHVVPAQQRADDVQRAGDRAGREHAGGSGSGEGHIR